MGGAARGPGRPGGAPPLRRRARHHLRRRPAQVRRPPRARGRRAGAAARPPARPEHLFPADVETTTAAYGWLLDQGVPAQGLAVAGESSGGGLGYPEAAEALTTAGSWLRARVTSRST
ncbi:MAG: alpha/beta hydrolase fold domain-containing protein [Pseudonocardia sp.]|nr:alpha/beta hydrolase fold domain-containing protein [Pseudonocardia sp.]